MKFSLFVVAIALMGCSTYKGQRNIASDESGDLVVRTIQKEIGDEFHEPGQGIQDYVYGTSATMNELFAGKGLGESDASMTIPAPEIPEGMVADLKLKRAFVYIQPKASKNYIQRLMNGGSKVVGASSIDKMQMSLNGVEILKYQKAKSDKSNGFVFVITTEKISEARRYLRDHAVLGDLIKSINQMKSGLVVELDDVIASEKFQQVMSSDSESLEKLGVKLIDQCSSVNCLDVSGEDVNLLPLGKDELKFHATVKSKKAPQDSKIDGFVEFELKVQLDGI